MTAIVVVKSSARISLLTDRALYDAEGVVRHIDRKVYPVVSWNGAIFGLGNLAGSFIGASAAEAFGSFDEFVAKSATAIRDAFERAVASGEMTGQTMVELHAFGWSEARDRTEAYVLHSSAVSAGTSPLFEWAASIQKTFISSPVPSLSDWYWLHRQGAEIDIDYDAQTFDAERHGLPLMEVLRRIRAEPEFLPSEAYLVGGGVDLTEITRDGVTQRMLREWPDVVGEPILPGPLPRVPLKDEPPSFVPPEGRNQWLKLNRQGLIDPETLLMRQPNIITAVPLGMNRQQRRALERQDRKAVRVS